MALLTVEDLAIALPNVPNDRLQELIVDAEAIAAVYAPCITSPTFKYKSAAKAIIKKAIVYEIESAEDSNNVARQATGPHSVEYKTPTRSGAYYSKSQIETLQRLCATARAGAMQSIQLESATGPSAHGTWR